MTARRDIGESLDDDMVGTHLSKYGENLRINHSFAISPAPSLMTHCTATAPRMLPSALIPTDTSNAWLQSTPTTVPKIHSENCKM